MQTICLILLLILVDDWDIQRRVHVSIYPTCQACGAKGISVHHIKPRHLGGTNSQSNLLSLCDDNTPGGDRKIHCHWIIGHGATSWETENPYAREQAAATLKRRKMDTIESNTKNLLTSRDHIRQEWNRWTLSLLGN